MRYTHTRVDAIEKATKRLLASIDESIETVNEGDLPVGKVDNIPVTAELFNFCTEIRKVNRHVKFGVAGRMRRIFGGGSDKMQELYVYMEGHTYAMMRVGYGDYSIRKDGLSAYKYMVSSRMIKNEKYRDDNEQYSMATSESIDRAMKNVKKYMRPYSPVECADMTFENIRQKFSSINTQVANTFYNAKGDVVGSVHLRAELFHMLDVGYEFLSEDFKNMIVKWRDAYQEEQTARTRALHAYYVNVRIHREEMVCDVIEVLDAHKLYKLSAGTPVTTYKMEELPDYISGSLAALSMVEDEHYVDGVGLRVDSATFWVQR